MSDLSEKELQELLEFSIDIARKAGALILEGSQSIRQQLGSSTIDSKTNSVDLVTEWDVKVEELIKNAIQKTYPDYGL